MQCSDHWPPFVTCTLPVSTLSHHSLFEGVSEEGWIWEYYSQQVLLWWEGEGKGAIKKPYGRKGRGLVASTQPFSIYSQSAKGRSWNFAAFNMFGPLLLIAYYGHTPFTYFLFPTIGTKSSKRSMGIPLVDRQGSWLLHFNGAVHCLYFLPTTLPLHDLFRLRLIATKQMPVNFSHNTPRNQAEKPTKISSGNPV